MRHTKIVSMWPVGLIGSYGVSAPIVDPLNGSIVGFFDGWIGDRVFAVDMASFAVNVEYFLAVCSLLYIFFSTMTDAKRSFELYLLCRNPMPGCLSYLVMKRMAS